MWLCRSAAWAKGGRVTLELVSGTHLFSPAAYTAVDPHSGDPEAAGGGQLLSQSGEQLQSCGEWRAAVEAT